MNLPTLVYHADWSSNASKRWGAKAALGSDGRYTASQPKPVNELADLFTNLRTEAGDAGCVFAGFDFPIGVPDHYAKRAEIANFRTFLPELSTEKWKDFFRVCDKLEQISVGRPFYPNHSRKGSSRQHLLNGHKAAGRIDLLRRCEIGGDGQRQACTLFWTLGGNQVGRAAITGWRDMLVPALKSKSVRIWPFDGELMSLFQPGSTVIAETYPAECYGWFDRKPIHGKTSLERRKEFASALRNWARTSQVAIQSELENAICSGFPLGKDDSFDAVVGLFGMLQVCLGKRNSGEPNDDIVRNIEGWILGRSNT